MTMKAKTTCSARSTRRSILFSAMVTVIVLDALSREHEVRQEIADEKLRTPTLTRPGGKETETWFDF
jgi:hypothetical protein